MHELFSREFSDDNQNEVFTIFRVEANLFQAKSKTRIIVLWKANNAWDGASNQQSPALVSSIGEAIDYYYTTHSIRRDGE